MAESNADYHEEQTTWNHTKDKVKNVKRDDILFVVNMSCGLLIFAVGVYQIVTFFAVLSSLAKLQFFGIFTPWFFVMFGLVLIALETGYRQEQIYDQFKFMKTYLGRCLFQILLAIIIAANLTEGKVASWICGVAIFIPGIYYFVMFCMGKREFDLIERKAIEKDDNSNASQP